MTAAVPLIDIAYSLQEQSVLQIEDLVDHALISTQ
jgi:hypothetical protein